MYFVNSPWNVLRKSPSFQITLYPPKILILFTILYTGPRVHAHHFHGLLGLFNLQTQIPELQVAKKQAKFEAWSLREIS